MKKVLGLLAITGFVACSNGETKEAGVDTNSQSYKDSVAKANAPAAPAVDSAALKAKADSTAKADSIAKAATATPAKADAPKAH
ncbi:MAG: hypothetical protein NTZ59_08515 [Bacteroidetes bacterium]|jgi:hypothetical protein|nr:hypothetical protein [Bacteroidota bacterium]